MVAVVPSSWTAYHTPLQTLSSFILFFNSNAFCISTYDNYFSIVYIIGCNGQIIYMI